MANPNPHPHPHPNPHPNPNPNPGPNPNPNPKQVHGVGRLGTRDLEERRHRVHARARGPVRRAVPRPVRLGGRAAALALSLSLSLTLTLSLALAGWPSCCLRRISPCIFLYLPISPCISMYLPGGRAAACGRALPQGRRAPPFISLHPPCISVTSVHLPTSSCISLYLLVSPCISLYLPGRRAPLRIRHGPRCDVGPLR